MIKYIQELILNTLVFNSILGICLYHLPLIICLLYYSIKSIRNYLIDKKHRMLKQQHITDYYYPTDTIGMLLERFIVCIVPIINLMSTIFVIMPDVCERYFVIINDFLSKPVVSDFKVKEEKK